MVNGNLAYGWINDFKLRNVLMHDFYTSFSGFNFSGNIQHLTLHESYQLGSVSAGSGALNIVNSLLVGLGSYGNVNSSLSYCESPGPEAFQTVGAGYHYLAENSIYRDAGTENIDSGLMEDLKKLTTHPPETWLNPITSYTTLRPRFFKDTDEPDLGYHYAPLDYAFNNISLQSATLRLRDGVAICVYGTPGINLLSGARLDSEGSPTNLVRLVRYQAVQEQSIIWGNTSSTMTMLLVTANHSTLPEVRMRFTDISLLSDSPGKRNILWTGSYYLVNPLALTDCQVRGGRIYLMPYYDGPGMTVALTNNLVHRAILSLTQGYYGDLTPFAVYFRNNLFYGGSVYLSDYTQTAAWGIYDNLFDTVNPLYTAGYAFANDYNGYINTTQLPGSGGHDQVLAAANYQSGPLGDYYLPTNSPLIDNGSRAADQAGLYHYTVHVNQAKESNSTVDIGMHYIALSAGKPVDSDDDCLPDYVEDKNGDGNLQDGETSPSSYDTDGDGESDYVEVMNTVLSLAVTFQNPNYGTFALNDWYPNPPFGLLRSPKYLLNSDAFITIKLLNQPAGMGNAFFTVQAKSESDSTGVNIILDEVSPGIYQNTAESGELLRLNTWSGEDSPADFLLVVDEETNTFALHINQLDSGYSTDVMVDRAEFASGGMHTFYGAETGDRATVINQAINLSKLFQVGDMDMPDNVSFAPYLRAYIKNGGAGAFPNEEADIFHFSSHGLSNGDLIFTGGGLIIDPDSSTFGINNYTDWNDDIDWVILACSSELNIPDGGKDAWRHALGGIERRAHGICGFHDSPQQDLRQRWLDMWQKLREGKTIRYSYYWAMEGSPAQPWAILVCDGAENDKIYQMSQDRSGTYANMNYIYLDINNYNPGRGTEASIIDEAKEWLCPTISSSLPTQPVFQERLSWSSRIQHKQLDGFYPPAKYASGRLAFERDEPLDQVSTLTMEQAISKSELLLEQAFSEIIPRLKLWRASKRFSIPISASVIGKKVCIGYLIEYDVLLNGVPVSGDHVTVSISGDFVRSVSIILHEQSSQMPAPRTTIRSNVIPLEDALQKSIANIKSCLEISDNYEIFNAELCYAMPARAITDNDAEADLYVLSWRMLIVETGNAMKPQARIKHVWLDAETGELIGFTGK